MEILLSLAAPIDCYFSLAQRRPNIELMEMVDQEKFLGPLFVVNYGVYFSLQ